LGFPREIGRDLSADVAIDYGDRLVIVEVASGQLRLEPTQIMGLQDAFNEDVQCVIVHNARQLHRTIEHLLQHAYVLPGIEPDRLKRIYPILLTLAPMPEGDRMWHIYETAIASQGFLDPRGLKRDVARLQLMTVEDVEMLPGLIGKGTSLAELLERKDQTRFRNLPLKNFVLTTQTVTGQDRRREREYDRIVERIREIMGPLPP
jgi:hypothetical protein